MKKWLVIGCIILLLIVIGVIFILLPKKNPSQGVSGALFPVSTDQKELQPEVFTTNFYKWYIVQFKNNVGVASTAEFKNTLSNWLSPAFTANFDTLVQNTGSDPLILAQDYQNSWLTTISATVLSSTPTTASLLVTLGSGTELHQLIVNLALIKGYWHIDSVTQPTQ